MSINYNGYARELMVDIGAEATDESMQKAEAMLIRVANRAIGEYARETEGIVNSALSIYVFVKSVIPEADVIRYEGISRFWFRIGSERFIIEISPKEINVYQFIIGEMWKETELSKKYKDALNESALYYGVF